MLESCKPLSVTKLPDQHAYDAIENVSIPKIYFMSSRVYNSFFFCNLQRNKISMLKTGKYIIFFGKGSDCQPGKQSVAKLQQ